MSRTREIREQVRRWTTEPEEPGIGYSIPASPDDVNELLDLLVKCDAFISHMLYRGSWPGGRYDVERLIGEIRE